MSSQINGISDNFMPTYSYEGPSAQGPMHSQMPVHENHQMYMNAPKQEMESPRPYSGFVPMAQNASSTTRANGSPTGPQTQNSAPDRKVIDNRPPGYTSSFHATPFQAGNNRKRRADALGFPVDAGPFFSQTKQHHNVYNMDRTNSYKLHINSKVDRGFFLADNDWTCYRRNYFQISSAFSITATNHPVSESETPCLIEVDGQFHTVSQFLLGITARVSNSDKKIELVQHTPKRDKGPQMVPMPKPIRAGGNLNLSSVGSNSNIVTFERIQFKTATANNGKRRAAQQYYVVLVDLYAQVESGEQHRVATSTSAPLVVRGRSPGHYADNHDRYNPIGMNPAFPNDRHMGFPHPQGNGVPSGMPGDFSGAPFPQYGQYPQFTSFPPVSNPNPIRNDALSLIMTSAPNTQTPPFHPQHPHQSYMVPGISDVSSAESNNPDMYNNTIENIPHDQKIQQMPPHQHHPQQVGLDMHNMEVSANSAPHSAFSSFESRQNPTGANAANSASASASASSSSKSFMKIEIPPQPSTSISDHPMTSSGFNSQEYVEGYGVYNGHPPSSASQHHGGYHSDGEQQHHPNAATGQHHPSPQVSSGDAVKNVGGSPNASSARDQHDSKSPQSTVNSSNSTSPTLNYRMGKMEEDKL